MRIVASSFKNIEDKMKEAQLSQFTINHIEVSWKSAWNQGNPIGYFGQWEGLFIKHNFTIKESDVSNVEKELGFKLKCNEIAEHYNKILKKNPNWRKMRCPQFFCTTTPIINIKGIILFMELPEVFK